MPKPSLPVRLALLVAGTALPLIVFAAFIVFEDYEHDRRDASQRVLETVRSIRLVLDAEVTRITGGLEVLALTDTLRNGEFDGFRHIASGFLAQYGKDGILLVADREGRQLFSSTTTDTPGLPCAITVKSWRKSSRPKVGNIRTCSSARRPDDRW